MESSVRANTFPSHSLSVSCRDVLRKSLTYLKMRFKWRPLVLLFAALVGGYFLIFHLFLSDKLTNIEPSKLKLYDGRLVEPEESVGKHNGKELLVDEIFKVSDSFHFPQPHYSWPTNQLLKSNWVRLLKTYLTNIEGKQVSVVTSTEEHTAVLINWLISAHLVAKPPLENVLVLSMGKKLHDMVESRGFFSLYVSAEMVVRSDANITRVFSQVHIVRLAVDRLINHLGFDVVNYDTDAILLKNPQKIFDSLKGVDLIGTFGKGPASLFRKWGVTLNTGVMFLRASPMIEHFWETMSQLKRPTTDDQGNINLALDFLDISWVRLKPSDNIDNWKSDIHGIIRVKKLSPTYMFVMLLSFGTVCRHTCAPKDRDKYTVWHALAIKENRTLENKMKQARAGSAWFLSEHWQQLSENKPSLTTVDWLRYITDKDSLL